MPSCCMAAGCRAGSCPGGPSGLESERLGWQGVQEVAAEVRGENQSPSSKISGAVPVAVAARSFCKRLPVGDALVLDRVVRPALLVGGQDELVVELRLEGRGGVPERQVTFPGAAPTGRPRGARDPGSPVPPRCRSRPGGRAATDPRLSRDDPAVPCAVPCASPLASSMVETSSSATPLRRLARPRPGRSTPVPRFAVPHAIRSSRARFRPSTRASRSGPRPMLRTASTGAGCPCRTGSRCRSPGVVPKAVRENARTARCG